MSDSTKSGQVRNLVKLALAMSGGVLELKSPSVGKKESRESINDPLPRIIGELSMLDAWIRSLSKVTHQEDREIIRNVIVLYSLDWSIEAIQGWFIAKKSTDIPFEIVTNYIHDYGDFSTKNGVGFGMDDGLRFFRRAEEWLNEEFDHRPVEQQLIIGSRASSFVRINPSRILDAIDKAIFDTRRADFQIPASTKYFFKGIDRELRLVPSLPKLQEFIPSCIECGGTVNKYGTRSLKRRGTIQIYRCTSCKTHFSINRALFEIHQVCPQCNTSRLVFPDGDPIITAAFSCQVFRCFRCDRNFSKTDYTKAKFPSEVKMLAVENVKLGLSTYQSKELLTKQFNESPSRHTVWRWVKDAGHFAPQFKRPTEKACQYCGSTMYHKHDCPMFTFARMVWAVKQNN